MCIVNGESINKGLKDIDPDKSMLDRINIFITTDISSRGLDFKNLDLVINYDFPTNATKYLHRCGRTGRGLFKNDDKIYNNNTPLISGKVISFFNQHDLDLAWHIQMSIINQYKRKLDSLNNTIQSHEDVTSFDDNDTDTDTDTDSDSDNDTKNNNETITSNNIGTTNIKYSDLFTEHRLFKQAMTNPKIEYQVMSQAREYERHIDLRRISIEEMDPEIIKEVAQRLPGQNDTKNQDPLNDDDNDDNDPRLSQYGLRADDFETKFDNDTINDDNNEENNDNSEDNMDKSRKIPLSEYEQNLMKIKDYIDYGKTKESQGKLPKKYYRVPWELFDFVSNDDNNTSIHSNKKRQNIGKLSLNKKRHIIKEKRHKMRKIRKKK